MYFTNSVEGFSYKSDQRNMDRRLVEAALRGNETTLNTLIQEDPLILHRISLTSFGETPLHIASLCGNLDFVRAILSRKPEFLTKTDSFGRCPLHLACADGHLEIVKKLFHVCPEVALRRDQDGRTPLGLAALNEQIGVLTYLLQENPLLKKMVDSDNTILHLCIRHNSIEALKLLVDCWSRDEVIDLKDENGNNLLHLAVIHRQIETVKYLLEEVEAGEKRNSINRNGFTAIDILDHCPRDLKTLELQDILMKSSVRRSKELNNLTHPPSEDTSEDTSMSSSQARNVSKFLKIIWHHTIINDRDWVEKNRGNLLITATLIATISFQAGLNPPGGVWQDSNNGHNIPGTSIFASRDFNSYFLFYVWDSGSLVISSAIILLIISGVPLNNKLFMASLMLEMTVTISFMFNIYATSMRVFTSKDLIKDQLHKLGWFTKYIKVTWDFMFYLMVLLYLGRFIGWFIGRKTIILKAGSGVIKYIRTRVCVSSPSNSTMI